MSNPQWGQNWRGHPWSRWESIMKRPTIKGLQEILETYAPGTVEPTSRRQPKQMMVGLAMAAMDNHDPPLTNAEVDKIFKRPSRSGNDNNTNVPPTAPPTGPPPIVYPTHPNTAETTSGVSNQGTVFAPANLAIKPGNESGQSHGLTSNRPHIIIRHPSRVKAGSSAPTVGSEHGVRQSSRAKSGSSAPTVGPEHGTRQSSRAKSGSSAPAAVPGHLPSQIYPIEPGPFPPAINSGNTSGQSLGDPSTSGSFTSNTIDLARDVLNYVTIPLWANNGSIRTPDLSSAPQASAVNPENTAGQDSEIEIEFDTSPSASNLSPPLTVNLENTPRQLPDIKVEAATPPSAGNSLDPPIVNLGKIPPQVLQNLSVPSKGINREARSRQTHGLSSAPRAPALNSENASGQVPGISSVPPGPAIVPGIAPVPSGPVIVPGNAPVPTGSVIAPQAVILPDHLQLTCIKAITPDQVHLTHNEEARRVIRRFLRAAYNQRWHLEATFHPYLPVQPIFGGHVIDSDATLQSLIGRVGNPDISSIRIGSFTKLSGGQPIIKFTKTGTIFPCRGRGPFWHQNSCALDCVIIAARFLNLGITFADRGNATRGEWLKNLPPLERNFLGLIGIPWEGISDADSIVARHRFLSKFLDKFNNPKAPTQTKIGDFLSAIAIWGLCTSGMGQLKFSAQTHTFCSSCNRSVPRGTPSPIINHDIGLPQMNAETRGLVGDKPHMSALLNLYFGAREKDCRNCNSTGTQTRRNVVYGDLPTRLVVLPDASYRDIVGATSRHIAIDYQESGGTLRTANYRWLGGIYQHANHYRVYWTDCKPDEDRNDYMVYDGMILRGVLWGGNTSRGNVSSDAGVTIPSTWSQGADILFYERTDPSITALQHAADAVNGEVNSFFKDLLETSRPDPPQAENRAKKRKRSVEENTASESEALQDEFGIGATMAKYRKKS